jgi:hypothetical protein
VRRIRGRFAALQNPRMPIFGVFEFCLPTIQLSARPGRMASRKEPFDKGCIVLASPAKALSKASVAERPVALPPAQATRESPMPITRLLQNSNLGPAEQEVLNQAFIRGACSTWWIATILFVRSSLARS